MTTGATKGEPTTTRKRRRRPVALPERTLEEVMAAYPLHRQSLLADFDNCALSTLWQLEALGPNPRPLQPSPYHTPEQARGVLFHRYAARVLQTLAQTGNDTIPVAEALEILYEVCLQQDVPDDEVLLLPARTRRELRIAAIMLLTGGRESSRPRWSMERLIDVERRLSAEVSYPHPDGGLVTRTITGQPDALIADPPDGIVVLDWKTTRKAPPAPPARKRMDDGRFHGDDVIGNVSYMGYFQQRVYGLLILKAIPSAAHCTLREFYPFEDAGNRVREATVLRSDLEHIERELAVQVALLDRGLAGGSGSAVWKPQQGRHCQWCPRPAHCPIPVEDRREGRITSDAEGERVAAQFVYASALRENLRPALRARVEETGRPIPVKTAKGRYVLGFEPGTRRFGMMVPEESDRGPLDASLEAAFSAAAERKRGVKG